VTHSLGRWMAALAVAMACAGVVVETAEKPVKIFARSWQGRRVVLKRALYTLVFDETGRLGRTRRGRSEGLTVTTPAAQTYYQFDGRQSQKDLADADPNRLVELVTVQYQRAMHLDIGTVSTVTPVMLMQFPPGLELIVRDVQVDRDRVRLTLFKPDPESDGELATSLTVQWPTPLSSGLSERAHIEALIGQFVQTSDPTAATSRDDE
jgi:hypothetical protein